MHKDRRLYYKKEAAKEITNMINNAGWDYIDWDYSLNGIFIYKVRPRKITLFNKSLYLPLKIRTEQIILKSYY